MPTASPTLASIFSDARDTAERGDRLEALKEALNDAIERRDTKRDTFVAAPSGAARNGYEGPIGIVRGGTNQAQVNLERLEAAAERFGLIQKSVGEKEASDIAAALADLNFLKEGFAKDITVTSPGNLHPYDLEPAAKWLVPRFTPLRNEIARTGAHGTAREYRRILGYSNTGMGGVPDQSIFFNSESDTNSPLFGQLALRRGQKIAYAMDVKTISHVEASVSDEVTWKAQFANLGFLDSRATSQMALLWSHMLGEEKAMLWSRGSTALGYSGAVAAPGSVTAVAGTGSGSFTGVYKGYVTARSGGGESVVSAEFTTASLTSNTLLVTVGAEPIGALSYNLYLTQAAGGSGTETFQLTFTGNSVQVGAVTTGGAAPPGSDSTSNANGYDGFLTVLSDPNQSGYVSRVNAPLYVLGGTSNLGDKPFQDMFGSLYASVYADPDEVWTSASIRRELADWIRSDTTGASAYRIMLRDGDNGVTVGQQVSGILNESSPTDKLVDLRVHPYMPAGAAFCRSRTLDIPNSGIGDTTQILAVQDYMSVDWPQIQFTYDSSTYWYGSMVHYAPKWNGCLLGIQ